MLSKLIPGYGLLATLALSFIGTFFGGDTDTFYVFVGFLFLIFGVWGGIMLIKKEKEIIKQTAKKMRVKK